jgi:4-hydroxyphenylpyruvate dioxygenase
MNAVNKIEQHNPIGTDGFEFVEYTAPTPEGIQQLRELFTAMGFTETAKHRSKEVWLFQQNDINFVLNGSPTGHVREFGLKHGPSACAMAFRVENAAQAAAYVESQGATLVGSHANFGELNIPCVEGIGGSLLYLVDRFGDKSIYDVDFEYIEGRTPNDNAVGLKELDHLTHNVKRGQMDVWSGFYERIANFREIRYFDIEGKLTGLLSRAMTAPCGKIRIPINESADDKSQIEEFIREYHPSAHGAHALRACRPAPAAAAPAAPARESRAMHCHRRKASDGGRWSTCVPGAQAAPRRTGHFIGWMG